MKKRFLQNFLAMMVIVTISLVFTGCSSEDEPISTTSGNEMLTRSGDEPRDVAHYTRKTLSTVWEQWNLNFEDVVKVEFNFEGSDSWIYGLNTPAYLCIDNILFQ